MPAKYLLKYLFLAVFMSFNASGPQGVLYATDYEGGDQDYRDMGGASGVCNMEVDSEEEEGEESSGTLISSDEGEGTYSDTVDPLTKLQSLFPEGFTLGGSVAVGFLWVFKPTFEWTFFYTPGTEKEGSIAKPM